MIKIVKSSTFKKLENIRFANEIAKIIKYLDDNFKDYSFFIGKSEIGCYTSVTIDEGGVKTTVNKVKNLEHLKNSFKNLIK